MKSSKSLEKSKKLDIRNLTRRATPSFPFEAIKNHVLGKNYELSLVFVGDTRSRTLNRQYRGKDKRANVLSFPLTKDAGEIFLNLRMAETGEFSLLELFIHGLFHLKGLDHGPIMEHKEQTTLKKFQSRHAAINRNGNRHRNLVRTSGRRRTSKR
jgi:rRNA maturation RNase YbeY